MSQDKFYNNYQIRDKSLYFLSYLSSWSQCGIDWSLTMREEIQEAINQPVEEKKSKLNRKVVRFSILTALSLLAAATWIQVPRIYQTVQEAGKNSVEQLKYQGKQNINLGEN